MATTELKTRLRNWSPVVLLIAVVSVAWCMANDLATPRNWSQPTAYLDPEKCDVIHIYAAMKAGSEGQFIPCLWKGVRELGAPFVANWNDWPTIEEVQWALFGLLARMFGVFAGMSVGLLLGHVLAAGTFYAVARRSSCSVGWAFTAALAFGLAPYLFAQSPHHFTVELAWHVPLFLLVWRWVSTDPGIEPGSRRFWRACGIGFLSGLQNPYFTNVLCQLTVLGAGVQWLRKRSRPALVSALAVVGAAAVAFALMNLDTWTYKLAHGPNEGALVREYKWLEIYGLKIKDLFIPPVMHRWDTLSSFSKAHRQAAPLLDEGASYQGIVGLVCLLWLVITAVRDMIRGREKDVPMEAWQVLWIVLMFTTGGLNALFAATTGFTMFRGGCRYSVVILAITLLWAARRLSAMQTEAERTRPAGTADWRWQAAAAFACLVILWDQVPRAPTAEETATIARQVAADREFTEKMEGSLPAGAMVFQMPVIEFPESPAPGVPPYDHFRPYLYSKNLRYSFGSMKGREREKWQPALQAKFFDGATLDQQSGKIRVNVDNARIAVDELRRLGFSAIYVNRNGFPDRGKGIEEALLKLGCAQPPIRSDNGDIECILLRRAGGSAEGARQ
jgi:phosphoglycerol transferase